MSSSDPAGRAADPGAAARRAAAEAARRTRGPGAAGHGLGGPGARRDAAAQAGPPETVIGPTTAQRALVPLVWGATALFVAVVAPMGAVSVLLSTAGVALAAWVLAGRAAVVLRPGELVVRRPVGQVVIPLSDVRAVERRKPVLTERAEVVREDGRRVPLPAPHHGPAAVLRDPAFDERITLIRYRVARDAPPGGTRGES